MDFNPTYGTLDHEDCDLHYWSQGSGPLIVFVPGGNGHGLQYNNIIASLSDSFTCATFDRRQMSASRAKVNHMLRPAQQARDLRAIIQALGFSRATVFGSSGGGIIALQFALDYPELTEHVIAHEAPTMLLLPEGGKIHEWIMGLYELSKSKGIAAADEEFQTMFKGFGEPGVPPTSGQGKANEENFWEYEFLAFSTYVPNLYRLQESGVSVGLMRGARSRDALYALTTVEQQKILDCPLVVMPGHHQGYEVETDVFAPAFRDFLALLKRRAASKA